MRDKRKTIFSAFYALVLVISMVFGPKTVCLAGEEKADANPGGYAWVWDAAGLLTDNEAAKLNDACEEVSAKYEVGVSVVTTDDFGGGDIKDWQRQIFAKYGLGLGDHDSGIMLAISMAERDWGIVGFGDAIPAFTTYGRERMGDMILDDLSDGDYYDAFSLFVSLADEYLAEEAGGEAFSQDHRYKESVNIGVIILVSFVLSFIISLAVVLFWKKGMNTRVLQTGAGMYMDKNSFELTGSSDRFLYHTVTRTRRPQESDSSGSGSMHSDSSGTSGKF